jgi:hypothetical protein
MWKAFSYVGLVHSLQLLLAIASAVRSPRPAGLITIFFSDARLLQPGRPGHPRNRMTSPQVLGSLIVAL